jgi:heme exporter protein B
LLSLDRLYQADFDDGSLDQIALSPLPLELTALSKALVHWLSTGLPLLAAAPILALMLNAPVAQYLPLLAALALATPALSLLGGLGAALTMGSRRGGILLTLLILPLYVPVLIFAAGVIGFAGDAAGVSASAGAHGFGAHLLLLGGVDLALLAVTPWATAAALRQALRS